MSKFQNVSKDLLYFWSYDNEGLKLAQLRFYEVPTVTGFQGSGVRDQGSGISVGSGGSVLHPCSRAPGP